MRRKIIEIEFEEKQTVYHVGGSDRRGVVTGHYTQGSLVQYAVSWDNLESKFHQAIELTTEKPIVFTETDDE